MAAQRSRGLLLCCLMILLAAHEVQGLSECMDGCPSTCQRELHESLVVCAIFCGLRCTCTGGGGSCSFLGSKRVNLNSNDQDQILLAAARAKAAAQPSPVSTGKTPRKIPKIGN